MADLRELAIAEARRLIFYANRSTPEVRDEGEPAKPKKGYGKVVKVRKATEEESHKASKGWLRVDAKGNTPGKKGYRGSSDNHLGPSKAASAKAVRNRQK